MSMNTKPDNPPVVDTDRIGSRMSRMDPDIFSNQSGPNDESPTDDDQDESVSTEENVFSDEPIDADGDPTGEPNHH